VGLLTALEELGAGPTSMFVKSYRAVQNAAKRLDVGPVYLGEVLRDMNRPWQVAVALIDIHGNTEAELTFNESKLTPAGALALQAERDDIPALPIGIINGTVHQGGHQPPFPTDRVVSALLRLLDNPKTTDQELEAIVGPPVFAHGCEVTGDIPRLLAGEPVTLRLYPRMFVVQIGTSLAVELTGFPPRVWAHEVVAWINDHLSSSEETRFDLDFERLPISNVEDASVGVVDHSNERVRLTLEAGADPEQIMSRLRHDLEDDPTDYWADSPTHTDVPANLDEPIGDLLRHWITQHNQDGLADALATLQDAVEQQNTRPARQVLRQTLRIGASFDRDLGVLMVNGRSKTFPPQLARQPLPESIDASETVHLSIRRHAQLSGTVGRLRVEADLTELLGRCTGTLGADPFDVTITESGGTVGDDLHLALTGSLNDQPVELTAKLHPPPGDLFGHAEITGRISDEQLAIRVEGANGGLGSSDTVAVEGTLGNTQIELYGATNHRRGVIIGTVATNPVQLHAKFDHRTGTIRIDGRYQGPLPILLMAAVILQTFM
jgi:hypothetical protein